MNLSTKLKDFALALIDEEKAKIVVPCNEDTTGYWFGGGNMIEHNGNLYISGRYRNSGDSRTGLELGDRGSELAIFESTDKGKSFHKIHSIFKKDLPGEVLSIEGTAMNVNSEGEIELFVSSEKLESSYPAHLEKYLKKGTGVWNIDIIRAKTFQELTADKTEEFLFGTDSQFIHVKDPFYYKAGNGDEYLMFCTHPFNWSSSNTGYMKRKPNSNEFEKPVMYFFAKGHTWDVAMTRGTYVFDMPKVGVLKDQDISLVFYDGGECVRNMDEHEGAVKRPRGYSCEELGGLAYTQNYDLHSVSRVSIDEPLFLSPYGTACSRYVTVCQTADGIYAIWQQSQKSKAQPLVMNFLDNDQIAKLLS